MTRAEWSCERRAPGLFGWGGPSARPWPLRSYCRAPLYVALQTAVPQVVPPPPEQTSLPLPQLPHPSKWTAAVAVVQFALGVI